MPNSHAAGGVSNSLATMQVPRNVLVGYGQSGGAAKVAKAVRKIAKGVSAAAKRRRK